MAEALPVKTVKVPIGGKKSPLLSIKETLYTSSNDEEEILSQDSSERDKDDFTEAEIKKFWEQYLEGLRKNQTVLYNVLNTTTCLVKENYTIFFEFPSNSAYDEFENLREDIFQRLKIHLNNYSIGFSYEIKETQKTILLSPKDKYEKMLQTNPLLEKLKNEFRLDIS